MNVIKCVVCLGIPGTLYAAALMPLFVIGWDWPTHNITLALCGLASIGMASIPWTNQEIQETADAATLLKEMIKALFRR